MRALRLLLLVVAAAVAVGVAHLARAGALPFELVRRTSTAAPDEGRSAAFAALARSPRDVTQWLRLGDEAQRDGDLTLARAAFRAAQEIAPRDGTAHARLGFLLYEAGQDEAALEELRRARAKGADVAMLDFTLSMMRAHVDLDGPFPRFSEEPRVPEPPPAPAPEPANDEREDDGDDRASVREESPPEPAADEPPDELDDDDAHDDDAHDDEGDTPSAPERSRVVAAPGPAGACEIALERRGGSGIFIVDALVNGTSARLIVDTGASLTVLSRDFLAETGLRLEEDGYLTARTAAGPQRFGTATVETVEVGARVATDVRVALCDECGMPGSDGLLGLDVQEPLGMSLFPGLGTVRFADCWE